MNIFEPIWGDEMAMVGGFVSCADGKLLSSFGDFSFNKNESGSFSFTFPTDSLPIFVATPEDGYQSATVHIGGRGSGYILAHTGYGDGYKDINAFTFIAIWP